MADFIIIDTGAGISNQVMEFVLASPEILLVTTPEPSSLTDSYSLLKALYKNPNFTASKSRVHVIANRVTSYEDGKGVFDKLNSVVAQFLQGNLNYLGMIPQDLAIDRAVRQQKTVTLNEPNSNAAKAFKVLANNLLDGTNEQAPIKRGISQIFTSFLTKRS